jgi:Tfp pilus assembly protein PilV
MQMRRRQSGFSIVETLLVILMLATLGFTGYFVYHTQQSTNKTIADTNKVGQSAVNRSEQGLNFAKCKQAAGSKILLTYPEQCVTKDGKTFTDTAAAEPSYLLIKEWGIGIKLTDADKMTYKLTDAQSVSLRLIPSVTSIGDCQDLGVGYVRDPVPGDYAYDLNGKQAVGGHIYVLTGSPAACSADNGSGAINQLRARITGNELPAATIVSAN